MRVLAYMIVSAMFVLAVAPANADPAATFAFEGVTNNNAGDTAIGEAQLFMDVEGAGSTVTFTFRNEGPDMAVISEIYFDDGSLLGISTIFDNPPLVDFAQDASPPNLPGGELLVPPFEVTAGFLAEATPAAPEKGVGPGESVGIMFDLVGGATLQNVLDEFDNGTIRAGIHVIAFATEGSESFVNGPGGPPVPEPATLALLGVASVGLIRRRQRA